MRRKPNCGFDSYFVKHVLEFLILIYVLYKSGINLNSYELWSYSHVLICLSMDKWTLCEHFYSYVDQMWSLYNIRIGCHVIMNENFRYFGRNIDEISDIGDNRSEISHGNSFEGKIAEKSEISPIYRYGTEISAKFR